MTLPSTHPDRYDIDEVMDGVQILWMAINDVPDPLHRLHLLRIALHGLHGEVDRTVGECRDVAVTWDLIAKALQLNSKQAAQARYGH